MVDDESMAAAAAAAAVVAATALGPMPQRRVAKALRKPPFGRWRVRHDRLDASSMVEQAGESGHDHECQQLP